MAADLQTETASPLVRSPLVDRNSSSTEGAERDRILAPQLNGILDDDDDDDFELTFSLDVRQRAVAESLARSRQVLRSEEYRQLFHLPPEEVLIQDFNCALQKKILLQGHMYLFEHYVCFYSNIFGYEKKKIILLKDVTSVRKARTVGLFPNAIEIVAWGKKSFFASFLSRDEAYRLIIEGWFRHSKNAIMDSDTQSNASVPVVQPATTQDQHEICESESSFESRENMEAPSEPATEAEIAVENSGELNDSDMTEIAMQLTDSCNVLGAASVHAEESLAARTESALGIEDDKAPEVPQQYKMVVECELPVDVRDFFRLFFSDESIKFCEAFHKRCGDEGFQCTSWAQDQHFGHVRDVSFRHPVKVYFGPKASNCQEVQRYRLYQKNRLIVETSQQMNDIPYGDYFCVKGWWDVSPLMERAVPHCAVRVFVDVVFSKKTVWKGKIEQGTYDECRDVYATWLAEAHQLLKEKGMINEQPLRDCAKQQKLKRKHDVNSLQILGNKKVSKNMGNISVAQVCAPEGQSQQPVQALISPARTGLAYLSQQLSPTALNSISQVKMLVVICVLLLFFLIHTGIIIALSRTQKIQYLPFDQQKCVDYHGSLGSHQRGQDTLWLEQSTRILWEEVNIAEARLKTMLQTVEVLKASLNLAERISSKELQSAD